MFEFGVGAKTDARVIHAVVVDSSLHVAHEGQGPVAVEGVDQRFEPSRQEFQVAVDEGQIFPGGEVRTAIVGIGVAAIDRVEDDLDRIA